MGSTTSVTHVRYLLPSICQRLMGDAGPLRYDRLSRFLQKMRMVCDFQLVLHADCVGDLAEGGVKELERGVAIEMYTGG